MRKTNKAFLSVVVPLSFFSCMALSGCVEEVDTHYNLATSGTVYYEGEQTISLLQSDYSEYKTTFLSSISKEDISFSGVLSGKSVKSLQYVSDTEVKLTVEGKVKATREQSEELGSIEVSHKALANGAKGVASLYVDFCPKMLASKCDNTTIGSAGTYVTYFTLPYGNFVEVNVNTTNITVPVDGVVVEPSIEEGDLKIKVSNFTPFQYEGTTYTHPVAKIDASVTTFNKELYVTVGTALVTYNLY